MPDAPVIQENHRPFSVEKIRSDFPILHQKIGKYPLVYLDNAATTQKPASVIDSISHYYESFNANIHRGAHHLANRGTEAFESVRKQVATFIGAESADQIIFTKGTTEGINLVANGLAIRHLKPGDEILISAMEHHANIVPWQLACERSGAVLKVIPISDAGELDLDAAHQLLTEKVKVFSLVMVSNALGTINPVAELFSKAKKLGIITLADAAQAVAHFPIRVQDLHADFLVFSSHKLFGPTGTGVLYGKRELLESLPPYQGGGEMIKEVTFEKTTWNEIPFKFEAGTPNIADVIGLGAALDYLSQWDTQEWQQWENHLLTMATAALAEIPGVQFIGTAKNKASVLSFNLENQHPSDVGTLLDQFGIAVRTGHHCCQPLMRRFKIPGTVRASFSFYNTEEEVTYLAKHLQKVANMLS